MAYRNALFELKGKSLQAALDLEKELEKEIARVKPKNTGNLADIQGSWKNLYVGLLTRLEKENPDLLIATGLHQAAIQIREMPDSYPRAYLEYPQIFLSPEKSPRYFMYAPIDYKGDFFKPQDALAVTDKKQERAIGELLFAGGWLGNAPLIDMQRQGTALPKEYQALMSDTFSSAAKKSDILCFIAAGRSLAIVHEYEAAKASYDAAVSKMFEDVRVMVESAYPPGTDKSDVYVNMSYSEHKRDGANSGIEISVGSRRAGGNRVPMPENPHYNLSGDYIFFRDDTQEGRVLKALCGAVPKRPDISDYAELRTKNGKSPQLRSLGAYQVLVYSVPEKAHHMIVPPDSYPLPARVVEWLREDENDNRIGIKPPPMPKEVANALASLPPLSGIKSPGTKNTPKL